VVVVAAGGRYAELAARDEGMPSYVR
jgi:hypothetical protein